MQGRNVFLQWALMATLIALGATIAGTLGWFKHLFGSDPTHVTYVTVSVFVLATAWCGNLAWQLANGGVPKVIDVRLQHARFASSLCVSVGLIGTAIGYYIMLKNGNAMGDPSEIIKAAFANTSIAIVNTIFGAVCGVLLEVQAHFIDNALEHQMLDDEDVDGTP